ncbi:hypothetical protein Nepgr_004323 [Nepenthes gracilis]|uniref:Ninja-family protein n=1 Tax=Nepenthes gracilis TaxID=150966 RepID=A0AAD3S1E3_NEPGR|nr:hypothetical protein Nepgr_004323 [Nepenthes gracilis]
MELKAERSDAEVTSGNHGLEEDELELCLGLPVDRKCKKSETIILSDVKKEDSNLNGLIYHERIDSLQFSDSRIKRELLALRRQEAKKKREEKKKSKNGNLASRNDRVLFEKQGLEARIIDRERREEENHNEGDFSEKFHKNNNRGFNGMDLKPKSSSPPMTSSPIIDPVLVSNGGHLPPHLMPCLASGGGFRPYKSDKFSGNRGVKDVENRRSESSFSKGCSYSGISDYQSTSAQGGSSSSSDAVSRSQKPELPHLNAPTSSSLQTQTYPLQTELERQNLNKASSSAEDCRQMTESLSSERGACLDKKQVSDLGTPSSLPVKEADSEDKGKAPNPPLQILQALLLPQMPRVSTTGNGPDGKTITGFLYRYTKTEVSIMCVCHGTSFSPSEFVEHAGGVGIEHPLKHIKVVPF